MAEKKGVGHAYNVDFLNVVFAASSLFLFLSVIWMVWDDYDREWKNTQRRFARARDPGDAGQPRAGGARRRSEQADGSCRLSWRRRRRTSQPTRRRSTSCEASWPRSTRVWRASRRTTSSPRRPTTRTATTSRRPAPPRRPSAEAQGRGGDGAARSRPTSSQLQMEKTTAERQRDSAAARPAAPARSASSRSRSTELHAGADPARARASTSSRRACVKDYFRNAPLLDFMAPTLKVQQIILPNVVDDVNFMRVREDGSLPDLPSGHRSRSATRSIRSRSGRIRT